MTTKEMAEMLLQIMRDNRELVSWGFEIVGNKIMIDDEVVAKGILNDKIVVREKMINKIARRIML